MTFKDAKEFTIQSLKSVTDSAQFEANNLLQKVTGFDRSNQLFKKDASLTDFQTKRLKKLINLRKRGVPLQYILGEWEFYGLKFKVGKGVLIPRPDTETIVELALDYLKSSGANRVFDFCAGSGAIGISVSVNSPTANVIMVEKSRKAFRFLEKNIGLNFSENQATPLAVKQNIFKFKPKEKCDLLICNPPYIDYCDMRSLQKEVKKEPKMALYGGKDGLWFYKKICQNADKYLNSNGRIIFEIGRKQGEDVSRIMTENGFENVGVVKDLSSNDRAVFGDLISK